MIQADSVHSTPPTNTSVNNVPRSTAHNSPGLARQQREREKALRRLAGLRRKAADEIDRLLAFLDASDPYVATEAEYAIDDGPCDCDELEFSFVGVNASAAPGTLPCEDECEADYGGLESDNEPSLGGVDGPDRGGQIRWAQGSRTDLEEQSDDEGVTA